MILFKRLPLFAISLFSIFFSIYVKAQTATYFDFSQSKAFIENKGQFTLPAGQSGEILYAYDGGPTKIYFTTKGVVYSFTKVTVNKPAANNNSIGEDEEGNKNIQTQTDVVNMEWEGCDANCRIVAEDKTPDYFSYYAKVKGKENNVNHINGYKQIIYKNLYPGIDVEYVFNPNGGVEYSLILQPGADVMAVKMKYVGKDPTIDESGNVHVSTLFGDIIDHKPGKCVNGDNSTCHSWFRMVDGNRISFGVSNYHPNQALIIDPWTITPSFPNSNKIWNCQTDAAGNVYLYGGDMPLLLKKYNSTGTLQWTYTTGWDSTTYWLGTLITNRAGISYITSGANGEISKITTGGALVWHNNPNGILGPLYEYWHMAFNCDQTQLVVSGTELPSPFNTAGFRGAIFNINLTSGAIANQIYIGYPFGFLNSSIDEGRSICASPNGNYYFLTLDSIGATQAALTSVIYKNVSTYNFSYGSPSYTVTGNMGQNNIKATTANLYTQNGTNVHKRDIATGNILTTQAIPGGVSTSFLGSYSPGNSGIDLDSCGNVYVGSSNQVVKYDANLNQLATFTTPSAVYDVNVNTNSEVIACGDGFAVSIAFSACKPPAPICKVGCTPPTLSSSQGNIKCNGNATGTATVTPVSLNPPYTYSWAPSGGSNATATGLSAGTYTCTVTDSSGCSSVTSVTITQPVAITVTITPTSTSCGNSTGSASASTSGGTGAYTYSWAPSGGTTSNATGLSAGNYTVTITDANSCSYTASTTINSSGGPSATSSQTNILCAGNSTGSGTANVTGGTSPYTYSWVPTGGTNSTASNLSAGTYTCLVTDNKGCSSFTIITITQPVAITATITPTSTSCGNNTGTASASASGGTGAYTYSWAPSGGSTSNATGLSAGNYTLTITDANSCTYTASTTVNSSGGPSATSTQANILCGGNNTGTSTAIVTGGTLPYTYSWVPTGGTNATASNLSAGTYTCIVTDNKGCMSSFVVTITQPTPLSVSYTNDSICKGDTAGFTSSVSGGTLPYTYSWTPTNGLSCTNCPSPMASPTTSTCYMVTVLDANGCTSTAKACMKVKPLPDVTLIKQSKDTVCNNSGQILLFGTPSGGTFSGTGIHGNFFYPDSVPLNQYDLFYYTYTGTNGCTSVVADSVYVIICTGINTIIGNNDVITIYPNPNNGRFVIQSSQGGGELTVEIYDVLGHVIKNEHLTTKTTLINLSAYANGVYFYRVITTAGVAISNGKLIIQK